MSPDTEPVRAGRGDLDEAPAAVREAARDHGARFGRYVLVEMIGEGGMGAVWRAWQSDLGRWVALKLIKGEAAGESFEDDVPRFVREAKLAASLSHPNIVEVYEAGEQDGRHFIAMQYVDGDDLKKLRVTEREAAECVRQAAVAVHVAHERGVIHRDLKPANLMRTRLGHVYVMDFGLARSLHAPSGLTISGSIVGTPSFMSPEQARSEPLDARTDVYSLGATLYALVTGHAPFEDNDLFGILKRVTGEEPIPPRKLNARLDRTIETIVMKAMEKAPERRYATAQGLSDDLGRHLRGEAIHARPASAAYKAWLRVRQQPVASAALALLVVTLATLGTLWFFTRGSVRLIVSPSQATVTLDGEPVGTLLSLRAGIYRLRVEASDHDPFEDDLVVRRGESRDRIVTLARHMGLLNVACSPKGSEILVDGEPRGSELRRLPLETGRHRIAAWADGRFEQEREIVVRRGETVEETMWLDAGTVWFHTSAAMPGGPSGILPGSDVDGDGAPDVVHSELTSVVIRSGRTGAELGRSPSLFDPSHDIRPADLGGAVGRVHLIASRRPEEMAVVCLDASQYGGDPVVWAFVEDRTPRAERGGATAHAGGDLNGDGTAEVLVAERDGRLWVLDGGRGDLVGGPYAAPAGMLYWEPFAADRVVWATEGGEICAIRTRDGGRDWSISVGPLVNAILLDVDGDGRRELTWCTAAAWGALDPATGERRFGGAMPEPHSGSPNAAWADLDGARELIVAHAGRLRAVRAVDAAVLWDVAPGPLRWVEVTRDGLWLTAPDGTLVVSTYDGLEGRDPVDGSVRWRHDGIAEGVIVGDWDGDGRSEIFAGMQGRGLLCLDAAGRERWMLRMDLSVRPVEVLPDVDGDGLNEVLVHGKAALLAVVRGPRTLWAAGSHAALRAAPVALGGSRVVQFGRWAGDRFVTCFDGRTGAVRWRSPEAGFGDRAPAVADWDGDGDEDLVFAAGGNTDSNRVLMAMDSSGGHATLVHFIGRGTDYATPAVADFDGDGRPDAAWGRWDRKIVAVSSATGKLMWEVPTRGNNMGGAGAADLDGDGLADVVAPSMDGHVYALRGYDGEPIWKAPIGHGGSRSPPLLHDLTGDGVADVVVGSQINGLWVLDGVTGEALWNIGAGPTEGWGRPVFAGGLIVAPMGQAGMAAFDWEARAVRWTAPERTAVMAGAAVADLDGDGEREVVIGTRLGEMVVVDLATGERLWGVQVGTQEIEADPVVVDLDGDGVLDILIACHDGTLTAIGGAATRPARRAWLRRQDF